MFSTLTVFRTDLIESLFLFYTQEPEQSIFTIFIYMLLNIYSYITIKSQTERPIYDKL